MSTITFGTSASKECGRGVLFTFANGVTVSIQAHETSYAEHDPEDSNRATLVEVGAWYDTNCMGRRIWATNDALGRENDEENGFRYNDVLGHQTPDQVLDFMTKCAALPSKGGAR